MIGFIGSGNMGSAIIEGIISSNICRPSDIMVSDKNTDCLNAIVEKYGIKPAGNNREVAVYSDILFLAVKPNVVYDVIDDIKVVLKENAVVVSIVAGQSIEKLVSAFDKEVKLVRVMPNTPATVGEGMAAISPSERVTEEELGKVLEIFNSLGKAEVVAENIMDAVTAVSGSSPAYVFMLIEAMADGAVMGGMPRQQAYKFAAQAVLGSAKMALETGKHPAELKDMVCSPAGTTIDAVAELENGGFRSSVIKAMKKCMEKSSQLGK